MQYVNAFYGSIRERISESLKIYLAGKNYQTEIRGRRRKRIEIILEVMGHFIGNYLK